MTFHIIAGDYSFMFENKILVEVINESGVQYKGKFPIEENCIVIEKPNKARGTHGYLPAYNQKCILPYYEGKWPFRKRKEKLMLWNGSDHCIEFRDKQVDFHLPTREMVDRYNDLQVMTHTGATMQQLKIPGLLYVLIFVNIMISIGALLIGSGVIRFVG